MYGQKRQQRHYMSSHVITQLQYSILFWLQASYLQLYDLERWPLMQTCKRCAQKLLSKQVCNWGKYHQVLHVNWSIWDLSQFLRNSRGEHETLETICSVFHWTPSPQQFRDPIGGLWLTQPRVPEWNSWDPSGACSRANPASRHKLDTNYTLDVSMCEQRMQETCWTGRKHFWSLEAHRRLKLFNAKVQHVIGRVAVHWEASAPKLVSQHDEGLFFREILHFIPGLYGKRVFFFLRDSQKFMISVISKWGWNKPANLCLSDLKCTLRFQNFTGFHTWVSRTDVLPWHHSFIHRPLATNWNPQNQFFNLDFCKCFIPEYTVSQTSDSPCNGSCGPVFHPAFLFGVASKEYNMGVLQLTPCTPAWLWH